MASPAYSPADSEQTDPTPGPERQLDDQKVEWLTGPEDKVAEEMDELWKDQGKLPEIQRREAKWKVNELRRDGYSGVRLVRDNKDVSSWRAYLPMGGGINLELANDARRLCRVFVGNLMADPPAPQVFPTDTGEDDRDSADVTERALADIQGESRLDTPRKTRDALDTACTFGSGYIVYTIDPTGGGRIVRTMQASPLASTVQAPLIDPATNQPHGAMVPDPSIDPAMLPPDAPPPMMESPTPPPDPIERMVHQDEQQYTEDPKTATYDWKPDLKSEVLSGRNVRVIPYTAENIWAAHGVMVATFQPWKTIKSMFPDFAKLPPEKVEELVNYRPKGSDELLPPHRRGRQTVDDNALVWTLVVCYRECGEYPDGFYGIAVGGKRVPFRKPWVSYASGEREALLLPVSQVKLFRNGKSDSVGDGLMDDLGGITEVMAAQIGHILQYLDWFNNPTVYVPMHSTIQDSDILARKPIIRILPGGEPKMLQPPRYPAESMTIFELMKTGSREAAHTPETAEGVEDPNVTSGRHAYQIIAQAHAQLSEPKQNTERGYLGCCEIEIQYARAFQLTGEAKWTGDDGAFKMKRWQGADLAGDVVIKPGTMTMLSPAAKAQLVETWMTAQILTPEEGRDMIAQGVGAVVGLRDDPFKLEVRRQISQWEDGPPEGYQPFDPAAALQQQMATVPPEQQQQTLLGIAQGTVSPPVDPMIETLWQPRAHHMLPGVAQIRLTELAKTMATRKYHSMDRAWQGLMEQEFQRMFMGAQPPAPPPAPGQDGGGSAPPEQPANGMPAMDNPALSSKSGPPPAPEAVASA